MSRLRWLTTGESHGPRLVSVVEGIPAGLALLAEHVDEHLARRQRGYGRGGRMKIETDRVELTGGVRNGETLGSPIAMTVQNKDHQSWLDRMGAGPLPSTPEPLTRPRPGHADLAGGLKYDRHDLRDILERASARETASRVAVGAVCRRLLAELGIDIFAHVVSIGDVEAQRFEHPTWGSAPNPAEPLAHRSAPPGSLSWPEMKARARASDLACLDPEAEQKMKEAIHAAAHAGDTLGGVFEVIATGVMAGLGSHTQWDRKLDGRLAQAMCSIQAIKAVEIGDGWKAAHSRGSQVHDAIEYGTTAGGASPRFHRPTNRAGGLEGGITNGEPVVVRAAMKPIATLKRALPSVDVVSKEAFDAAHERSDICAVAAASIVGEAMVAITLCDAVLEKFGGDSMRELMRNVQGYREQVAEF